MLACSLIWNIFKHHAENMLPLMLFKKYRGIKELGLRGLLNYESVQGSLTSNYGSGVDVGKGEIRSWDGRFLVASSGSIRLWWIELRAVVFHNTLCRFPLHLKNTDKNINYSNTIIVVMQRVSCTFLKVLRQD